MSVPEPEVVVAPVVTSKLVTTDGRTFPLRSADLAARTEGGFASSTLTQVFVNPHDEALEVVYTMPLPADGAVLGYTVTVGDRIIRGEIQTRKEARKKYQKALEEGRVAGLLEQERVSTFEQSLGNIPAHAEVKVAIEVVHPLAFIPAATRLGLPAAWEYRFPTVVGARYSGGEGRVADREQLTLDISSNGTPVRMNMALTVGGTAPVTGLASRSHTLVTNDQGVIGFDGESALDRDVVVSWAASTQEVGVTVVEGSGLAGDDGRYVLVTVVPPTQPAVVFSRELTILLDRSGSMNGERLEMATRVVADLIRSLEPQDAFELLTFSSKVERVTPGKSRVPATRERIEKALRDLDAVCAGGGTNLEDALELAFADPTNAAQRQVVLLTDGDVNFEPAVVGRVAATANARLHVVAIGEAPNRALTQQAAAAGRGLELLVSDEASAARAAERLVKNTASPVLVNLAIEGSAVVAAPQTRLRDVFAGQPLVAALEVSPQGGTLTIQGLLADALTPWRHTLELPHMGTASKREVTPLPVGALFGRALVDELELQHAASGYGEYSQGREGKAELDKRIEKAALRHRIVSRLTSLVAVAESASSDPSKPRRTQRLEVDLPRDVSAEQFFDTTERHSSMVSLACAVDQISVIPMMSRSTAHDRPLRALNKFDSVIGCVTCGTSTFNFRDWFEPSSVTWSPSGQLVIEFAMPYSALSKPSARHKVTVQLEDEKGDRSSLRLGFDVSACTDLSTAQPNTTVRLVFDLKDGVWIPGALATLQWRRTPRSNPVTLTFTVPQRDSERGR